MTGQRLQPLFVQSRRSVLVFGIGVAIGCASPLYAQTLTGVFPTPAAVRGPTPAQVLLIAAPGPAWMHVTVYFNDPAGLPVASMLVSVPPGASSWVSPPFPTNPVSDDTPVTITAVWGSQMVSNTLTILRPQLATLSLSPNPVYGGQDVTITLGLDAPAGPQGTRIDLSGSTGAGMPALTELVIPPWGTSATLTLATSPVNSTTAWTIEATADKGGTGTRIDTLTIDPPIIESLELLADFDGQLYSVSGGVDVPGLVSLTAPAPAGGALVQLFSSDPALADVPASVVVPEGQSAWTFTTTTFGTAAAGQTALSALLGDTQFADLLVTPARLLELSVAPSPIIGGRVATGSVALDGVAPAGGTVVALSSASPSDASVAPTVVIPAGEDRAEFVIATARQLTAQAVQISASYGGDALDVDLMLVKSRLGDVDGDSDLDADDADTLAGCLVDPIGTPSAECRAVFDFNNDGKLTLLDAGRFQEAFTGPRGPLEVPRPSVVVDTSVDPVLTELAALSGVAGTRPLAALTDHSGIVANFIADELFVRAPDPTALSDLLGRWNGTLLRSDSYPDPNHPNALLALVRVDTNLADVTDLPDRLGVLAPNASSDLRVSSPEAMQLLAAAVEESLLGDVLVDINWVALPAQFRDRVSDESPTGPGAYVPNAFCWDYISPYKPEWALSGYSVGEAWRALEVTGRLNPASIPIAIIDAGYDTSTAIPNVDFPPTTILPNPGVNPRAMPSPIPTSGGAPAPWHGTNVMSAAMGVPDNNLDVAGPAGPVATARIYVPPGNYSDFTDFATVFLQLLADIGAPQARIFNVSGGVRVPAVLGIFTHLGDALLALARDSDTLIFASAGNDGEDVDAVDLFWEEARWLPCEFEGVICVGGLLPNFGPRHPNSNYGSEDVDIWAPYSVWGGPDPSSPGVQVLDGTSFSSPYVAGVAALIWSSDLSQSAAAVEQKLMDSRATGWGQLPRVRALAGVVRTFPSPPPDVCIVAPVDNCTEYAWDCPGGPVGPRLPVTPQFSRGSAIYFAAQASEPYERTPPSAPFMILWLSDVDGVIGFGSSLDYAGLSTGMHQIVASVLDADGTVSNDSCWIEVVNDKPVVRILAPRNTVTVCADEEVRFRGDGFDVNQSPLFQLPGASLVWSSNLEGGLGTGNTITTTLNTVGAHTISLNAVDDEGAPADPASITVQVQAAVSCETIDVNIASPGDGAQLFFDGYDPVRGQHYAEVTFRGTARDDADGPLSGSSLVWYTSEIGYGGDPVTGELGTGSQLTVRIYADDCTGRWHTITLEATDSDGNTTPVWITIRVYDLC